MDSKKVKILDNPDDIVVKVEPLQKVEEVIPAPVEEVPVEGAEVPEGQAPAEGVAQEQTPEGGETPKEG